MLGPESLQGFSAKNDFSGGSLLIRFQWSGCLKKLHHAHHGETGEGLSILIGKDTSVVEAMQLPSPLV